MTGEQARDVPRRSTVRDILNVGQTQGGLDIAPHRAPTAGAEVRDARAQSTGGRDRRWDVWTIVALLVVTIVGAIIRAKSFANTGLVPDDAWVALSSRVGLGTAWHMWVTAPGFGLVERTWMVLGPSTTWWYQLPSFVCGVAAVPTIFCLARYFKLDRCSALALAVVVCASPTCVTYSTRVKEYPVDFLLSCLLIALAETARRRPAREPLFAFAAASVGAFVVSASVGVLVVALWAALTVAAVRDRPALWRVLVAGVATASVCGGVAAVFYAHLSPTLTKFWTTNGAFIEHSSLHRFASSSIDTAFRLLADLLWASTQAPAVSAFGLLIVVVWAGLSLIALRRDPAMLGPALAVLVAFVASAGSVCPFGYGSYRRVPLPTPAPVGGDRCEPSARSCGRCVEAVVHRGAAYGGDHGPRVGVGAGGGGARATRLPQRDCVPGRRPQGARH